MLTTAANWLASRLRKSLRDTAYFSLATGVLVFGPLLYLPSDALPAISGQDAGTARLILLGLEAHMWALGVAEVAALSAVVRIFAMPWLAPVVSWCRNKLAHAVQSLPAAIQAALQRWRHAPGVLAVLLFVGNGQVPGPDSPIHHGLLAATCAMLAFWCVSYAAARLIIAVPATTVADVTSQDFQS